MSETEAEYNAKTPGRKDAETRTRMCGDCSQAEGVVAVGPLMVCPACAAARLRSLEAVARERAQAEAEGRARIAELEANEERLAMRLVEMEEAAGRRGER